MSRSYKNLKVPEKFKLIEPAKEEDKVCQILINNKSLLNESVPEIIEVDGWDVRIYCRIENIKIILSVLSLFWRWTVPFKVKDESENLSLLYRQIRR